MTSRSDFKFELLFISLKEKSPKRKNLNRSSNELLPKTKVVEFNMANNVPVQSFSSCHTKFGEKFEIQSV